MTTFRSSPRPLLAVLLGLVSLILFVSSIVGASGEVGLVRLKAKASDGDLWSPLFRGGVIAATAESAGKVLLTFDDGPDPRTTPVILDILDRANVKAVFLVAGYRLHVESPDHLEARATLREIRRRGHHVGNHTFIHQPLDTMTTDEAWDDINHGEQLITAVLGRSERLFRPPFGKLPAEIRERLDRAGFTVVLWSLDPEDWRLDDPAVLVKRVTALLDENPGGGILLLHDTNRIVVEALGEIIRRIRDRGAERRHDGLPPLDLAGAESFYKPRTRAAAAP